MEALKELINRAILVAHWRDSDVDTVDGSFATTDTDEMIRMESAIQEMFEGMEANDLICTGRVSDCIDSAIEKQVAQSISASTKANHLRVKELEESLECMIIVRGKDDGYDGDLLPINEQDDDVAAAMKLLDKFNK